MYLKEKIRRSRAPSDVVQYNKQQLELINYHVDGGCTLDQAIAEVHGTYNNPNSPYFHLSLADCAENYMRKCHDIHPR